jgi:hypothetical protein
MPPKTHLPTLPPNVGALFDSGINKDAMMMVADMLYKMGFEWTKHEDIRVWFNVEEN